MDTTLYWGLIGSNLAVITVVIALFTWNRAESRADWRMTDAKIDQTKEMMITMHNEIQNEMKDFHGRLCAIEEKYHQEKK